MSEHQLLIFLVDVAALSAAARLGGELAARAGVPLHVGELVVGICIGPSLFGWAFPDAFAAVFPATHVQRAVLDVVSWTGVILLAVLGGLEVDLSVLRRAGAAVVGGWIGGFGLPWVAGFALGLLAPRTLVPGSISRPVFAMFIATAMAISAIPVIARILMDLDLYGTRVGMIILSTAIADDTIGWIVLALVAGLATGGVAFLPVARTFFLTLLLVFLAVAVGTRVVKAVFALASKARSPYVELSTVMLLVLGLGAITQAIGVHLVLGAFMAAILIGRVGLDARTSDALRTLGMGFFVPFFFAYTGLKVNLTTLHGSVIPFAAIAIVVACVTKVVGGGFGSRLGGLPAGEALAVGLGLNARGAMELVIAAIGVSIGVLTPPAYAIVVLIAVITTVMTAPLLRICIRRAGIERSTARVPEAVAETAI